MTTPTAPPRYLAPGRMTLLFNSCVAWLTRRGLSVAGSRELRVRGRRSGQWRTTPVNLLIVDGVQYLVAPRGLTDWVRNVRVAGGGELRVGRRVTPFQAHEVADADKPAILRTYLKKWKWEVGVFFENLDANATDDELLAMAPGFPVFALQV